MIILTIRSDKPEAEVGLFDNEEKELGYTKWIAHRKLGRTIHLRTQDLLEKQNITWQDIQGIVFYKGPGSFTGLRIGAAVANALAMANHAALFQASGEDWIAQGIDKLKQGKSMTAQPEYGSAPHITQQKK